MPPFEVLLPVGAIGLYLFDTLLLLYSNELLLVHRRRWGFIMSSPLILGGRRLCFVNPLTPMFPQFRVQWSETDTRQQHDTAVALAPFLSALRPLQYLVSLLWLLLLALPVEIYLYGTGLELLVLMGAFYSLVMIALVYIFVRRHTLHVSGRTFAALSFDSLACAPFAVNLVRKLATRRSLNGNPIDFAGQVFDQQGFTALVQAISQRVGEEQQREYGQTPRWLELQAYRQQLAARISSQA
jgi:hypothetical protein